MVVLDREALAAIVGELRRSLHVPPSEDTTDELLLTVHITFYDYLAAVLTEPLETLPPDEQTLATRATVHGRIIADLLTTISVAYWRQNGTSFGQAEAEAATQRWIEMIAEIVLSDDPPEYSTAVAYVVGASQSLSYATRIFLAERGQSLDADDPRGAGQELDEDGEAIALLIWCAAEAARIAALLQPGFRGTSR
jgi:hypothetical protein